MKPWINGDSKRRLLRCKTLSDVNAFIGTYDPALLWRRAKWDMQFRRGLAPRVRRLPARFR